MKALATILVVLCLATAAAGREPDSSAPETERGRTLPRILDGILIPRQGEKEADRTLVLLVDATASLAGADFGDELVAALTRNASALAHTRIGFARVGGDGLRLAADPGEAARLAAGSTADPEKTIQNVYADVRRIAGSLGKLSGVREIALVTLENGDAEDDLERTVSALTRAGVRLSVVAREAFLSDSYWVGRSPPAPLRGVDLRGAESAFVEVPWGYLFQQTVANHAVPSGFAIYGLARLAGATGGTVYVFYPPSGGHTCAVQGSCPFCSRDHAPTGRVYHSHRLRTLAPSTESRREAMGRAAGDPYFAAVLKVWGRASKAGLVRSRPSVRRSGGGLRPERRPVGSLAPLTSLAFSSNASRAEDLARTAGELAAELERAVARGDEVGGSRRYRSIAELTRIMLEITRVNLLAYAAFCREAGPHLAGERRRQLVPPEIGIHDPSRDYLGIGYTTLVFCHGARPFERVRFPGGEAFDREVRALADRVDGFLAREANTPFAAAVRRSGLARFHLTIRGKHRPPPERDVPGSESESTATKPDRPPRGGGGDSGGGTGTPSSGGD